MRGSSIEYVHWYAACAVTSLEAEPLERSRRFQTTSRSCLDIVATLEQSNRAEMSSRWSTKLFNLPPVILMALCTCTGRERQLEPYCLDQSVWHQVTPAALPQEAVGKICDWLVNASEPHLITKLADTVRGL